jgi:hypothetical protein
VAKPNYQHARKQKELARKSRQLQKEQRRSARAKPADPSATEEALGAGSGNLGSPGTGGG